MDNSVIIINGVNLNKLGSREPDVYGHDTLEQIEEKCLEHAERLGIQLVFKQSNSEGTIVDYIQNASGKYQVIIINAGAYTHTSVAIHDALKMCGLPIIEVHLSNIYKREAFRHVSYISELAEGVICGFGSQSYELALTAATKYL
ncbi:MAG: type II 3-dehydroquinate dehydratase [Pseudomonadota bacterium]|nr:type II 3-dehydroquinate dehydratase [Pseudomonadota bacterium]